MTNDPDDKQDGWFVLLTIPSEDFPVVQPHPLPDRAAEGKPLLNRFITPSPSLWKRGGTTVKYYCWLVPVEEIGVGVGRSRIIDTSVTEVSCYQHLISNGPSLGRGSRGTGFGSCRSSGYCVIHLVTGSAVCGCEVGQ